MRITGFIDGRRRRALAGAVAIAALGLSVATASGSFAASPRASAASAPACATSELVVWLNTNGSGAAGSIFYTLEFTNLSSHPCTLSGFPGVSAVDLSGHRIGAPGKRDNFAAPHTVTLGSGPNARAAIATLRIVENGNFPRSSCGPVTAAGLRVYPPNQRASKLVPFPFGACSHSADGVLSVRAVR
jgi:Protein of unknown function (DUF4232)